MAPEATPEVQVVRAAFEAYLAQDATTAASLLADDYRFTSPQDDRIDKAAFMERCFPTATRARHQHVVHLVPAGGGDVLIVYEYELLDGTRYRNTELTTVRDGRLVETQVFFGGEVRP